MDQAIQVFGGEPTTRYGVPAILYNTLMKTPEPIELAKGKMPRFDFALQAIRAWDSQAQLLKNSTANVCLPMRDITIQCKKQGKGVRWEIVEASHDALFMDDDWCDAVNREKLYIAAAKKRKLIPKQLTKTLPLAEFEALVGAKSAAEAAAGTEAPESDDGLGSLLDE